MNNLPQGATEVTRSTLEATARILGEHSAAASALKDADSRAETGQEVAFFKLGNTILVGPKPTPRAI
jgi:hypothetical protein